MTDQGIWRKSSRSTQTADCVEVAGSLREVRDSKNITGPVLGGDVVALVREVRTGRFDRSQEIA